MTAVYMEGYIVKRDLEYKIVEHIATISSKGNVTKELNRVSYNGTPAKLDLRAWQQEGRERRMLKGITLTDEEAAALKEALAQLEAK